MRLSSCQGSQSVATLSAPFEEHTCQTSSVGRVTLNIIIHVLSYINHTCVIIHMMLNTSCVYIYIYIHTRVELFPPAPAWSSRWRSEDWASTLSTCVCIYIYIYRERERCTHMCIYIYICISLGCDTRTPSPPTKGSKPGLASRPNSTGLVYTYYLLLVLLDFCICIIVLFILVIISIIITPSPPTKSSGFRGFDSSRLLILRGGNYHVCTIL